MKKIVIIVCLITMVSCARKTVAHKKSSNNWNITNPMGQAIIK